jgi:uncharacterized membrane protein YhaH (DUF805 family)
MTFTESISICFKKYATFDGVASRSEYWWFWLFCVLGALAISLVSDTLGGIFGLATLLPSLAAGARRLHDTDRSGWWLLVMFVPLVGWIILVVLLAQEGKANRYGAPAIPA